MKISWGTGIVIAFTVFLLISFIMIFYFMNQKVDLVTDNYYEKTLTYQEKIDEAKRSYEINKEIKIENLQNQLKIVFPITSSNNIRDAEIYFYRPSDSSKDFKSALDFNNNELFFDVSKIEKGFWKVQLRWISNNESYSIERTLMIN